MQADLCRKLLDAKLVEIDRHQLKATRRWQAAMARAAFALLERDEEMQDERLAVVMSLQELLKDKYDDATLCEMVFLMQFIEHTPNNTLAKAITENEVLVS